MPRNREGDYDGRRWEAYPRRYSGEVYKKKLEGGDPEAIAKRLTMNIYRGTADRDGLLRNLAITLDKSKFTSRDDARRPSKHRRGLCEATNSMPSTLLRWRG